MHDNDHMYDPANNYDDIWFGLTTFVVIVFIGLACISMISNTDIPKTTKPNEELRNNR